MTKKLFSFIIISILLFQPFISSAQIESQTINYLKSKDPNPWITMALKTVGESSIENNYLKTTSGNEAINFCAPILAITALGENPRTFANQDLVAKLKSFYKDNQLGDKNILNDDIFGILALISAGESNNNEIIEASKNFIISHQNGDGGWGFSIISASDTNMTAMAIMALTEVGYNVSSEPIVKATNYLKSTQKDDGGFPYDPNSSWGNQSDAASTAWVVSALYKLNTNPQLWLKNNNSPLNYLDSLKTNEGYFKYQQGSSEDSFSPVTTSYAVIALSGKFYPINKMNSQAQEFDFRIEGEKDIICSGKALGPTALDIIKNASKKCSFTYLIQDTAYGPYLKKINNQEAHDLIGWLFLVNQEAPTIGANDYQLQKNDQVIWYFGEWGWTATRLSLDKMSVQSGESAKAKVEFYNNSWQLLKGAKIKTGIKEFLTDDLGEIDFALPVGFYNLVAEKDGYIRSNQITLKVGEPLNKQVSLKVEIDASQQQEQGGNNPGNSSISFTIDTAELNFGKLKPGEEKNQQIKISNNGNVDIYLQADISGDDIFEDYFNLDDKNWQFFESQLEQAKEKEIKASLKVPDNYNQSGQKQGVLIFWATQTE